MSLVVIGLMLCSAAAASFAPGVPRPPVLPETPSAGGGSASSGDAATAPAMPGPLPPTETAAAELGPLRPAETGAAEPGPLPPAETGATDLGPLPPAEAIAADATPTEPARPMVWLVAPEPDRPADRAVREWLAVELLAEGYPITVHRDRAQIELAVSPAAAGGWTVSAAGRSSEQFEVAAADDPAVARLELLHRSVDALEGAVPRVPAPSAGLNRPAFAVWIAADADPAQRAELRAQLTLAVLAAGGDVVPRHADADQLLCAAPGAMATEVQLWPAGLGCAAVGPSDTTLPNPQRGRSVGDRARALVADALAPEPEPPPAKPAVPFEDPLAPEPEPDPPPPAWRGYGDGTLTLRGGVAAGVLGRREAPDLLLSASGFLGKEPGLSGWLDFQLSPSGDDTLRIVEMLPAVGIRYRPFTWRRLSLDTGALLGMHMHWSRFATPPRPDFFLIQRATAFDIAAEGAVGLSVRMFRDSEFVFLMRGGAIGRSRTHSFEGEVLWARSAWRLSATAGVNFGRRLRR